MAGLIDGVMLAYVSMPNDNPLSRIRWLHHFTDSRNVATIRDLGGLYSRYALKKMGVESLYPGGNDWSLQADEMFGMDRYVHLCFRTNHPMEYLARNDGRIERTTWLNIEPSVMEIDGVMYSHGVSNKSGMAIHPIRDAIDQIDFEVICSRTDWRDPQIKARLDHAELCEVLVPGQIPLKYFEKYLPNG
jgi:hypothetical protein